MQHDPETNLRAFLDLAAGQPASPEIEAVKASDPAAYERGLAAARNLLRHAEAARLEAYPESAVRRALSLVEGRSPEHPIRRLLAALVPTPRLAPALRSGRVAEQRLYEVDGYELDLVLHPEVALIGQVVRADGSPPESGAVLLQITDGSLFQVDLDESGEFVFRGPPPAPFDITVDLGSTSIVVESFNPDDGTSGGR